jgi:hypothetical protein
MAEHFTPKNARRFFRFLPSITKTIQNFFRDNSMSKNEVKSTKIFYHTQIFSDFRDYGFLFGFAVFGL